MSVLPQVSSGSAALAASAPQLQSLLPEDPHAAIEEINQKLQELQTSLDIIHDDASGRSAVIVRDSEGNILRQLPPEAVLHAFVQVRQIVGLLLDETI